MPIIVGAALGWLRSKDTIYNFLRYLNINIVHPIPSAWDYAFLERQKCYICVKTKSGDYWRGLFDRESIVSTDLNERDIYIEKVYKQKLCGTWIPINTSVLVVRNEIESIEFYKT